MSAPAWRVVAADDTQQAKSHHNAASLDLEWEAIQQPAATSEFYHAWLSIQCTLVRDVRRAVLFLATGGPGGFAAVSTWPKRNDAPAGNLLSVSEQALREGRDIAYVQDAVQQPELARLHLAHAIVDDKRVLGAIALDLLPRSEPERAAALRQLRWGAVWIERLHTRQELAARDRLLGRLTATLNATATVLSQPSLKAGAMALAGDLAERVDCERVSVGMISSQRIELVALSHSATFQERANLVAALREAMEEVIVFGASIRLGEAQPPHVAHVRLQAIETPRSILSVRLTAGHVAVGAMIFERQANQPFGEEDLLLAETLGAVLGNILQLKRQSELSAARRLTDKLRDGIGRIAGPRHLAAKFLTALVAATVAFLALTDGDFRVTARTVVEGAVQRAAVAPFDGYVAESFVRAGDTVKAGQTLCVLDDRDLKLEFAKWSTERGQLEQKIREAMANADRTALSVLTTQSRQADAQLALAEERLARTRILAPFDGVVVSGDLSQLLGSPVEIGKVLFQIAPLQSYRVILKVDDRDIADVHVGQRGELVLTGLTQAHLPFSVRTITSVATQEEGRNLFRVEAQVESAPGAIRPGMEGVGKIHVGKRRLLWIWTHRLMDWLRLQWWSWQP
jgi:multidrug efflux pump subunit AcrA (membrane-fusion protein)